MTLAGPEAGWYFDPDGADCERFWNGEVWTEHRRARAGAQTEPAATTDAATHQRRHASAEQQNPQREELPPQTVLPVPPPGQWPQAPTRSEAELRWGGPNPEPAPIPPLERRPKAKRGWAAIPLAAKIAFIVGPLSLFAVWAVVTYNWSADSARSTTTDSTKSTGDDWQRAVCEPGTLFDTADVLRHSAHSAVCASPAGAVSIGIGTYGARDVLDSDLAVYSGGWYAEATAADGSTLVVVPLSHSDARRARAVVEPLEEYGFQIKPIP